MLRSLFNVLCFPVSIALCIACAPEKTNANENIEQFDCLLTVGWHNWPPYQFIGGSGQVQGQQITLAKKLAKLSGCKLEFIQNSFAKNQELIKTGDIDITFDITVTEERAKQGYFSIPYRKELLLLYVRDDTHERCQQNSLSELIGSGFNLAITKGFVYGETIENIRNDPKLDQRLYYSNNQEEEIALLLDNKIDGLLEDPLVMAYLKSKEKRLNNIKSCDIKVYENLVTIMFSRKTVAPTVVDNFNAAIEIIKKDINYRRLWGLE